MTTLLQDLRFAVRQMRRSPGFAAVAVVTLALAIGANAVVFSILNALILRPLNVPQAQGLYAIERGRDKAVNHSYPDYLDLRDRNRSFDGLAAYNVAPVGIDTGNNPSSAWILEVTDWNGTHRPDKRIRSLFKGLMDHARPQNRTCG